MGSHGSCQLGVMAGGAVVKWCDGDTSKGGEWGQLRGVVEGLSKDSYSGLISVSWCTTTLVTDMSGCCSFASLMA